MMKIIDIEPSSSDRLFPSPNVQEWDLIKKEFGIKRPLEGNLRMTGHYRGQLVYLENGACVYRHKPNSLCVNGLVGPPIDGAIEDVLIRYNGDLYKALVVFNLNK